MIHYKYHNLKIVYFFVLIILSFIISGCEQKQQFNVIKTVENKFSYYENSRLSNYAQDFYRKYQLIPLYKDFELLFLNQLQDSVYKTIPLKPVKSALEKLESSPYAPIFVQNFDSIFYYNDKERLLYLINQHGALMRKWVVEPMDKNKYLIEPWAFNNGILVIQDFIFLQVSVNGFDYTNPNTLKDVYNDYSYLFGKINKDTIYLNQQCGKFPEFFTKDFYYTTWPSVCLGENNKIIFSFATDHQIYVYQQDSLVAVKVIKSKFAPKAFKKFNLTEFMNLKYAIEYQFSEPRYSNIFFNVFNGQYYRVFEHATPYKKESGEKCNASDKKWSLIILNSDFDIIKEVEFNPKLYIYGFNSLSFTRDGILLIKKRENVLIEKVQFSLINIP